ncbi:unnamed protein product [Closterium sp. NIES-53]
MSLSVTTGVTATKVLRLFSPPPLFLTPEPLLVVPLAPPPSRPAPSGVSHVTPQSSSQQRPVPVVSGGAAAEGGGHGVVGPGGANSGGAGSVRVETTLLRSLGVFLREVLETLAVDHGLTAPPSNESFESSGPYPELVGCLTYLMTCTRPNLAYPLSVLARFIAPGRHRPSHGYTTKRVAKYVASTLGMELVLGGKQPVTLTGFSDSLWADDAETRRSTQRYSFSLGTGAVSWRSTRASSISSSSCGAEVYAAAMAAQELRWLMFLLTDLGERPRSPLVLFADNRSAVLLCKEPRLVGKAKHIQLRYFLLRELQQCGHALVRRVVSKANTAVIFTKALPPCDHQRFCTHLSLAMKSTRQRPAGAPGATQATMATSDDGLRYGSASWSVRQRRSARRHRPPHENGTLYAMSHEHHCQRSCVTFHLNRCATAQNYIGDGQQQRPKVHFEVLERDMGAVRHEASVLVGLPSTNRPSDRADQSDDGAAHPHKLCQNVIFV